MKYITKKGKDLSTKFIEKWNVIMYKAFEEDEPLDPKNRKKFSRDIFFILYNGKKEILSVGRLIQVKIRFLNKTYNILGIADMVSVYKKKGYGKIIMEGLIKYSKEKKQTAVGFCKPNTVKFYKKCGLTVVKDLLKRFVYKNKGKIQRNTWDKNVIYLPGKDNFIKDVLNNPKEKVLIPIKHW